MIVYQLVITGADDKYLSGTIQNFVAIHPDNEKFRSVEGM